MWDEPFRDTDEGARNHIFCMIQNSLYPMVAMAMAEAGPTFLIGGSEPCQSTSRQQVFESQKAKIFMLFA